MKKTTILFTLFLALAGIQARAQCTESAGFNDGSTGHLYLDWDPSRSGQGIFGQSFTACASGQLMEIRIRTDQPATNNQLTGIPPNVNDPLSGGTFYLYDGQGYSRYIPLTSPPQFENTLVATVPFSSIMFQDGTSTGANLLTSIDLSSLNISVVAGNEYTFAFDAIYGISWSSSDLYFGGNAFLGPAGESANSLLNDIFFEAVIDNSTWDGSTWSSGTPTASTHAVINSNTAPGSFTTKALTIESGATLTLNSGDTATISGDVTNIGNGLSGSGTLRFAGGGNSQLQDSVQGNALSALSWEGVIHVASGHSLTTNGLLTLKARSASEYGTLLGNGTVTDNINAEAFLDLAGVGNDGRYYHLGAPFNNATLSDFNEGGSNLMISENSQDGSAWEWDAANAQWVPAGGGNLSSAATIGKGYALFAGTNSFGATFLRSGPGTLTVTGQPDNQDVNVVLSYNNGQSGGSFTGGSDIEDTQGWNFLANPYPAQLDWNVQALQLPANLENAIYVFTGSGYTSYVNGASSNGGSRYIAPFQAFFVQLTANPTGNFVFDADARVVVSGQTVELNKTNTPALDGINLMVSAQNGAVHDDVYVGFESQSTVGHDSEWDARKLLNSAGTPNLSVAFGGDVYSICRVPYHGPRAFPIQLDYAVDGETLSISADRSNLRSFGQVTLEDLKDGTLHDLKHGDYTFTYDAGYGSSRFVLHFGQPSIDLPEPSETTPLYAYPTENGLAVDLGLLEGAQIDVFNLAGQRVASSKASQGIHHLWLDDHGVFLVHIESDQQSEVIKVIR